MNLPRILHSELAEYAKLLLANGFRVFVFKSDVEQVESGGKESCATWLGFSRMVDEQECFASVELGLDGWSFYMPIKPSIKNGSSMFIGYQEPPVEQLNLTHAQLYASPTGYNELVGTQENYIRIPELAHLYQEMTA